MPLLSVVVADFLKRYDQNNKATLTKLNATLPIFIELIGDLGSNPYGHPGMAEARIAQELIIGEATIYRIPVKDREQARMLPPT